jgi:hypothetical protein
MEGLTALRRAYTGNPPSTRSLCQDSPAGGGAPADAAPPPFPSHFHTVTNLGTTVPADGDVNPYGIVPVPQTVGKRVAGATLVSNFNAKSNLQGTAPPSSR